MVWRGPLDAERLPGLHEFDLLDGTVPGHTHKHVREAPEEHVLWHAPQHERTWAKRTVVEILDPQYPRQWHLDRLDVPRAWSVYGVSGAGVRIAVVDDGLQHTHGDIRDNYAADSSYDFNYGDPDPYVSHSRDYHGTSAAGVAVARDDGHVCGVGSAYRAQVAGLRILSKASTDSIEARALTHKDQLNHIYTNSWGPIDDGARLEGPGPLARRAIWGDTGDPAHSSIVQGRNGLGSIYVWAGGNGRTHRDNCNYDGWANSRYTITVGATDYQDNQAWYSESCAMLAVSAPSSGTRGHGITTSDLRGRAGHSASDCTHGFGGTSSAAPLVAGVVALVLEANPALNWREVQACMIHGARAPLAHRDDEDAQINQAGLWFHHGFGFGMVNATASVEHALRIHRMPSRWGLPRAQERILSHHSELQDAHIPQGTSHALCDTIRFPWLPYDHHREHDGHLVVEHVEVHPTIHHRHRGDLVITLTSPHGTVASLSSSHGGLGARHSGYVDLREHCNVGRTIV